MRPRIALQKELSTMPVHRRVTTACRALPLALAAACLIAVAAPARAQDVLTKEAAAAAKASFMADLDAVSSKFTQLAQAFPQDKYTWRPMEGVRSVSEVLMLAATEGYGFIPGLFGAKSGAPQPPQELAKVTDKAQVLDHLNKGFAYAKQQLQAVDPATLTGKRKMMGRDMSIIDGMLFVGGDLHEHLGQLIAYARMNKIVPPWSK
jgi:DinB family protein